MKNARLSSAEMDEALFAKAEHAQLPIDEEAAELHLLFATMRENSALTAELLQTTAVRDARRSTSAVPQRRLAWALAIAAVAVSVVLPVEVRHRRSANAVLAAEREHDRILGEQRTDEALLSNIESDLSSSVPRPLEPLSVKEVSASADDTKGKNE